MAEDRGSIQLIDLARLERGEQAEVSKQIGIACREWGVFYIKNHGIQVKNLLFEVKNLFSARVECKQKAVPKTGYFGYFHKGGENTLGKKDCKEGLYLRAEYPDEKISENNIMRCLNYWPDCEEFPNYKKVVSEYLLATRQVVFKVAECMALHLGLEKSHFNERLTEQPFQQIGLFRYLQTDGDDESYPWGVGPHSDTGFLTVLLQDDIGGLQVKAKDGSWVDVPPIDGTLIVNVGDVAEIWTNGFCHSVMHRVTKPTTSDRYSVATFVDPSLDCIIVPGDAKGNSNCKIDERLKSLSSAPYKFEDFLCEYYAKSLKQ